jgi:hypothetical protein
MEQISNNDSRFLHYRLDIPDISLQFLADLLFLLHCKAVVAAVHQGYTVHREPYEWSRRHKHNRPDQAEMTAVLFRAQQVDVGHKLSWKLLSSKMKYKP